MNDLLLTPAGVAKKYLDKLLSEAGVKCRRKGNLISELFSPYGPHTYDGYLDEYMAKRPMFKAKVEVASLSSSVETPY